MEQLRKALSHHRRIHPFPARMAPSILGAILHEHDVPQVVFDPMAGSGSTLAAAALYGHRAEGLDTDPLAVLISNTLAYEGGLDDLIEEANAILVNARRLSRDLSTGESYPNGADEETRMFIRFWFCRTGRRQLTSLSRYIAQSRNPDIRNILWVALSRLIIRKENGASRAADVAHSRPHRVCRTAPLKPFDHFMQSVGDVSRAIDSVRHSSRLRLECRLGDARDTKLKTESINLLISSPPYLNAIDYIRASKMSLVWMGHQIHDLRAVRSANVGAETGIPLDEQSELVIRAVLQAGDIASLPQRQINMLARYAQDMNSFMKECHRILAKQGEAYLVVGNSNVKKVFISNSRLISILAQEYGLRLVDSTKREIPRNRRYLPPPQSETSSLNRRMHEEVVLHFRKL